MFSMPAKSENFTIPPFLAVEPCEEAKLDAANIAAPIASKATESNNRLCM